MKPLAKTTELSAWIKAMWPDDFKLGYKMKRLLVVPLILFACLLHGKSYGAAMSSYPTASSVVDSDKALISKSTSNNATQQAAMSTIKDYILSNMIDFSVTSPLSFNSTTGVLSLTPWTSQSAFETFSGWSVRDPTKSPKTVSKVTSTNYTIGTTSPDELLSGIIVVTGAATITAPSVAVGHTYIVVTRGDVAVSLDVNASDVMTLDGTALSAGDKATNTSKAGDTIACTYVAANDLQCWSSTKLGGHWTDGN